MDPFEAAAQDALCALASTFIPGPAVTVIQVSAVQPIASVTVTQYVHAANPPGSCILAGVEGPVQL